MSNACRTWADSLLLSFRFPLFWVRPVVHYTAYDKDGKAFETSTGESPLQFIVGDGEVSRSRVISPSKSVVTCSPSHMP